MKRGSQGGGRACNPSTWEAEPGGSGVGDQLGYIVGPCLNFKKVKRG
jgi:hypothetical protein